MLDAIEELLISHDQTRTESINLIVSENRMTDRARAPLSSDIQSRYAASFYAGTGPAQQIIALATERAKKVFRAHHANLSPISGNVALLGVVLALTKYGQEVGRVPPFFPGGGYPLNYEAFERKSLPLPFSESTWQIDLERTLDLLTQRRPPLVVLGSSIVTYPMPVQQVAELVHGYGGILAYDGSHALGLMAGGQYQDPLREGADILFGSTHKTFPGPQGGIVLTNDEALHKRIEVLLNFVPLNGPTMICNPHLARIASTAIVLEETPWTRYAAQVVRNARTIAQILRDEGVPMHGVRASNFPELTYCHQIVTNYSRAEGVAMRERLAAHHIHVDGFCRIGVSEITRLGFKDEQCQLLGRVLARLLRGDEATELDEQVKLLVSAHRKVVL